jgi:hypothetical protein
MPAVLCSSLRSEGSLMKFLAIFQQIHNEIFLHINAVPRLDKIEFSRLAKISKGQAASYRLKKGTFSRHCLYSTIYHTLKDHGELFANLEPVILQWGDYRLPQGKFWYSLCSSIRRPLKDSGSSIANLEPPVGKEGEKKEVSEQKVIYAEHGWLPRSTYQLSSKGCNSRSHIKFAADKDYICMLGGYERLQRVKKNLRMGLGEPWAINRQFAEEPFFLVALQTKTGNDLNLLYSGTPFARYYRQDNSTALLGQAVIDHVESVSSSCRLIFTLHPLDRNQNRYKVRPENRIAYAGQGVRTIDLLRHANCRGVIAINSNILHEALLWEKPALALGELLAAQHTESPFSGELQSFLGTEGRRKSRVTLEDQYVAMLLAYQWTLADLQNPLILREILKNVDALVPWNARLEYGF